LSYAVKELYYTLQGEGANTGRPAVFCRFSGCNLWSGHEQDREGATCRFCDTDFVGVDGPGGAHFPDVRSLTDAIRERWPQATDAAKPFVVFTGGEPLLQLDAETIARLHAIGFDVAVETNGTLELPRGVDWVCVSPKSGADFIVRAGDELKLVYPQPGADPADYEHFAFRHFFLQPMDGPERFSNTQAAIRYCLEHPVWKLSLQVHKYVGIR
jgi:7-carboxy-7-deazaguanine synthase (Cx14CxxC type)